MIIGDGAVAKRKAKILESYGARVHTYGKGQWQFRQFSKAFLVIAATNDRSINEKISNYCRKRNILVNVADSKAESAFLFPSVTERGPVSIGITTSGYSPLVSAGIREKIDEMLPKELGEITIFMGEIREEIKRLPVSHTMRKRIFHAVYQMAEDKRRKLKEEEVKAVIKKLLGEEYGNISEK